MMVKFYGSVLLLAFGLLTGTGTVAAHHEDLDLPIFNVPKDAWDALNLSVSGRLHVARPYALPCFTHYQSGTGTGPAENTPEPEVCRRVSKGLADSSRLIREFASYHNPTFSTCMSQDEKCTLGAGSVGGVVEGTCHQGTVPDYYIDASDVSHIQRGLEFAKRHKIPLSIKNTGHDYKGRSTGPNTLAIWTHGIAPDPNINENFTPEGCLEPVGPAVTYGAGQIGRDLYDTLDGTGYFAVGGSCQTVGVSGGWILGGGHSIVSPTYGLGVDNALQMRVVLPNGTFVTANRCQNQDIFFALRGGGGGTFGVVTETTANLHRDREFTYAFISMTVPTDPREINEILVANAERWADEGWGGLYGVDAGSATFFLGFNPNLSVEEAKASLEPVTQYLESWTSKTSPLVLNITALPSFWAAKNAPELVTFLNTEAGVSLTRSSRLVPRENFRGKKNQKELVDVLLQHPWASVLGAPTRFTLPESDKAEGPGEASITPAWRDALWHFTYTAAWDPFDPASTNPEALVDTFTTISKNMDAMRAITPGSGAYMSEGDVYEPDPIDSFWGQKNHDRLLKLKRELDPDNLLSCFTCVGWDRSHPRYRCYPEVKPDSRGPKVPGEKDEL